MRVEYFFENYIHAKFDQNRRFRVEYVPLQVALEWFNLYHVYYLIYLYLCILQENPNSIETDDNINDDKHYIYIYIFHKNTH